MSMCRSGVRVDSIYRPFEGTAIVDIGPSLTQVSFYSSVSFLSVLFGTEVKCSICRRMMTMSLQQRKAIALCPCHTQSRQQTSFLARYHQASMSQQFHAESLRLRLYFIADIIRVPCLLHAGHLFLLFSCSVLTTLFMYIF